MRLLSPGCWCNAESDASFLQLLLLLLGSCVTHTMPGSPEAGLRLTCSSWPTQPRLGLESPAVKFMLGTLVQILLCPTKHAG